MKHRIVSKEIRQVCAGEIECTLTSDTMQNVGGVIAPRKFIVSPLTYDQTQVGDTFDPTPNA